MRSAVSSSSVRDLRGDRTGLLLILWLTLYLTLAFLSWSLRICCLASRCGFWLPARPSPFCALVSIRSGEYFPLNSFSVTVPVGGCMQGWFPLAGLPWIPPCYAWGVQAPVQPLRHQFPSSSIGDEFKEDNCFSSQRFMLSDGEILGQARRKERLSRSQLKQAFLIDSDAEPFMYLIQCIRFGSLKVRRLNRALISINLTYSNAILLLFV